MAARTLRIVVITTVVLLLMGVSAAAALAVSSQVSKPAVSGTPAMSQAFAVSGFTTPTAKKGVTTVVKIQVLMKMDGDVYEPMDAAVKAKLTRRSGAGYNYSASITIAMTGDHAVQAIRYANGKVVGKSKVTYFEVEAGTEQVSIDSDSHADVTVAAQTPLDLVFHSPTFRLCASKVYFLTPDFTKTSSDPLTYHTGGSFRARTPGAARWRTVAPATSSWGSSPAAHRSPSTPTLTQT